MNTRQIIIPIIAVMGMMLLTIGPASASTIIQGQVFWSNGTACSSFQTTGVPEITNSDIVTTWNKTTAPPINLFMGNWYALALMESTGDIAVGDLITYNYSCGGETNTTANFTCSATGGTITFNITLDDSTPPAADLIVESITVNPICISGSDYWLFANESNEICTTIKNNGSVTANASYACFEINGVPMGGHIQVSSLAPGATETVCITDGTIRNHGDVVVINVTADCLNNVTEGTSGESNNESSISETVYNNGYKGKTYTGGSNMTTWKEYDLNGKLLYSMGTSYYWSAWYHPDWTTYNASWTSSHLPVQGTVKEARLYVMYNSDKGHLDKAGLGVGNDYLVATNNITMCYNGNNNYPLDADYMDRKGWGSYDDPYGMLVYNVTGDFNPVGDDTANLTNTYPGGANLSIDGMALMVIYESASEPRRQIFVNEECDMLNYKATGSYGTTPEEATAWAPMGAISIPGQTCARLITLAPSGDGPEGDLIVNGHVYPDEWDFGSGNHQIGRSDRDVTGDMQSPGNIVGFRANDSVKCIIRATNAFLVVSEMSTVATSEANGYWNVGTSSCNITNLTAVDASTIPNAPRMFPYGLISFDVTNVPLGGTVTVCINLTDNGGAPIDIPTGAHEYWKVNTTAGNNAWYQIPMGSDDGDSVITIELTDGGLGDNDGVADGKITDPGGIAASSTPVGIDPCPVDIYVGIPKTVNISLQCIADYGSGTIHLYYDKNMIRPTSVGNGDSDYCTTNPANIPYAQGHVEISAHSDTGLDGTVAFVDVTFMTAPGATSGCTYLNLTVETLYDRNYTALPTVVNNCTDVCIVETNEPYIPSPPVGTPYKILTDTGRARVQMPAYPCTNITNLTVQVTDDSGVDKVYVNLTPILGAGHDTDPMTGPTGATDGVWYLETNASYSSPIPSAWNPTPHILNVMAKDIHDNWNNNSNFELTTLRRGDVSGGPIGSEVPPDDTVDDLDYYFIAKYTVGLEPPDIMDTTDRRCRGEIVALNGAADSWNGIDMADALYIAMYVVGKEPLP